MALTSPIDWTTVENALHAWFSDVTGLSVIWEDQEAPRPPLPYGTLKIISGPSKVFGDDEHRITYDANQPAGEEIGIEVAGLREMTVTAQVFLERLGANGTAGARDCLTRAQSSLNMLSYRSGLHAAGLSVIEEMAPRDLSGVDSGTWISRAAMDVRLGLAASVTERTGYVDRVGFEPTYRRPDGSVIEALSQEFDVEIAGEEMRTIVDSVVTFDAQMAQWGQPGPRYDKIYLTTAGGLVQSAQPNVPANTTFAVGQAVPESLMIGLQTVNGAIELTSDTEFNIEFFVECAGAITDNGDMAHTVVAVDRAERYARPGSEQSVFPWHYDPSKSYPGVLLPFNDGNAGHWVEGIVPWQNVPPLPYVRFGFSIKTTLPVQPIDWVDWHVRVRVFGIPMTYKR